MVRQEQRGDRLIGGNILIPGALVPLVLASGCVGAHRTPGPIQAVVPSCHQATLNNADISHRLQEEFRGQDRVPCTKAGGKSSGQK